MKRSKMGTKMGSKMMPKRMAGGQKLPMVTNKEGKEVPFFAADGKGKMMAGGKVPKTKGYFKGGKTKGMAKGGKTKGYMRGGKTKGGMAGGMARGSGAARSQPFRKNG